MIQFHNGNWEHRAFLGQNLIPYGIDGSTGRRRMGNLPGKGKWHRLSVRAHQIGLDKDSKIYGMAITQWGGKVTGIEPGYFGNINLEEEDCKTIRLPKVETNYRSDNIKAGKLKYTPGDESLKHLKTAPGYKVELACRRKNIP